MHHSLESSCKPPRQSLQMLENIPQAPQLPASYPAVMLLALLPGLFFDVMNPRASQMAEHEGDTLPRRRRLKA